MTYVTQWTWEFDAPRERLWTFLADSDWVNQHAGLPRITPRFEPSPNGGTRKYASFRRGPLLVEWEEVPTIWRVPEFYTVERRYSRGPLRRFRNTTSFEALSPTRTRVVVDLELDASNALLKPLLPLIASAGKRGADKAFKLGARRAARAHGLVALHSAANPRFEPLLRAGVSPEIVAGLEGYIEGAEDRDLNAMRPYELADGWRFPRRDVLRAFLYATRAGLLNMKWRVICPGCRGPQGMESLADLRGEYHCPSCNVPFGPAFDRSVEVTFSARPLGRGAEEGLFCIASPQRSDHVFAQTTIAARASGALNVALSAGTYELNAIAVGSTPFVVAKDARTGSVAAEVSESGVELPAEIGEGTLDATITNELDRDIVVRVQQGQWPDTYVTAAQVTAMQEFRDLFSSEVLAPGLELAIETIAVLFTDLVGSTAMYSRTGDAPAFRLVTDHFEVMREVIARNEGTIVKTIGDAVMAVFTDPVRCFDAAVELDTVVMKILCEGTPLRLRVGFHSGPCIAMRANERIDYFGTNVNLAARLQSAAGGGDVTMALSDSEISGIAHRLEGIHAEIRREALTIKGFLDPIDVVRVTPLPE